MSESAKERERRHRKVAASLLVESLGGSPGIGVAEIVTGVLALSAPPVAIAAFTSWDLERPLVLVPAVLAMAVLVVLDLTLLPRCLAAWRLFRLRRIGHGFEVERYLALLSERRRSPRLTVELRFDEPWPSTEWETVSKALRGWVPGAAARWSNGSMLKIDCGQFDGTGSFAADDGSLVRFFTNRRLHDGFMRVVRKVVPPLTRVRRVVGLRVEVTGETVSLDAKLD
jgi:hypothetical protein